MLFFYEIWRNFKVKGHIRLERKKKTPDFQGIRMNVEGTINELHDFGPGFHHQEHSSFHFFQRHKAKIPLRGREAVAALIGAASGSFQIRKLPS